jgi:hypothetical protein
MQQLERRDVMRTGDILPRSESLLAEGGNAHGRWVDIASAAVGAILVAAVVMMASAAADSVRSSRAGVYDAQAEVGAFAGSLERSGTLSGLEVLF